MAQHRVHHFPTELQMTSIIAKCLSHPARISILNTILESNEVTFERILKTLPLAQPTVSHHLKYLVRSGMLDYREELPHTVYSLSQDGLSKPLRTTLSVIECMLNHSVGY